ncbi:transglutaminase domain-containing protein [Butyribacter sp.]|uniref:transglutaminase domain-containing protein n=1 Tax=Butyribacter sp. TaxID=2822465 RepID=UPI002A9F9411|nr:transglutaminase domain-containing protein [Butyribacter sp.]
MKKRILAMVLAITMATSVVAPMTDTVYAATAETLELVASYHNDEYGNLVRENVIDNSNSLYHMVGATGESNNLPAEPTSDEITNAQMFSDTVSAGNYLKEQMKQRNGRIVFAMDRAAYDEIKTDETISVYHQAIMHTENPQEGDYLKNQPQTIKSGTWKYTDKVICVYDFQYRTSLSEEQELTEAIKQMENVIPWGNDSSDVEKSAVREIYRYICDYFSYDTDSYNEHMKAKSDPSYQMSKEAEQAYTAYGAYKQRKAVCQGLADLFYRICLDRGIDCRIMHSESHAWNAVKIDDKWYMCDATGDVQKASYNYDNYLLARADLIDYDLKHKVDTYKWQDESVMWDWEVVNGYDWAVFEYNSLISTICRNFKKTITLTKSNKNGKQSTKLYDKSGKQLKEGTDYTVTYTNNYDSNSDKYNTKIIYTGIGKYAGSEFVKYYNKKIKAPKIKRATCKVIKREKKYDKVEVNVYFDDIAGASLYCAQAMAKSKNNKQYALMDSLYHKIKKCKNGEYCYTYRFNSAFCGYFEVYVTAQNTSIPLSSIHNGAYTIKTPSQKELRKVKVGKTVKATVSKTCKKHKDCYECGTCKHTYHHRFDDHSFNAFIYVK